MKACDFAHGGNEPSVMEVHPVEMSLKGLVSLASGFDLSAQYKGNLRIQTHCMQQMNASIQGVFRSRDQMMDRSQKLSFPHENEIRMAVPRCTANTVRSRPRSSQKAFCQHSAWMAEHHPRGHLGDGLAQAVVRSMNQHVGEPTTVSASVPKWRKPVSASSQSTSDTFSRSGVGTIVAAPSDIHTTCPPASVFNWWANQSARSH